MCVRERETVCMGGGGGLKDRRRDKKSCVCESCDEN